MIPGVPYLPPIAKAISIRIYDDTFSRVGEAPLYTSFTFTKYWYMPDIWELKINKHLPNATTLTPQGYVTVMQDTILNLPPFVGYIEKFEPVMTKDGKASEIWTMSGRSPKGGLLHNRCAIVNHAVSTYNGYDELDNTTYESALRHLVNVNCINALDQNGLSDPGRDIAGITLAPLDQLRGDVATAAVTTALEYHAATYTDITAAVNSPAVGDIPLPPISTVNDALYLGDTTPFHRLSVLLSTPGVYTGTLIWEYWNGAWTAIPGITDGTSGFKAAAGQYDVYWAAPADWATTTVNGVTQYWIRARCSALTSVTTAPLGTQIWSGLKLQTRGEQLLDLIQVWSEASQLNADLVWTGSGENFVWTVSGGTDRSGATPGIPMVKLSVDFRNVQGYDYLWNMMDEENVIYAAGSGTGYTRLLQEVYAAGTSRPTGKNRKEIYVDLSTCSDIPTLASTAQSQLAQYLPVQSLTFDYDITSTSLVLNRDFFLGDIIVVDFPGVATITDRITAICYLWDKNGYTVKITLGTEKPDLVTLVKKMKLNTSATRRK
jgi:hypothetical protein